MLFYFANLKCIAYECCSDNAGRQACYLEGKNEICLLCHMQKCTYLEVCHGLSSTHRSLATNKKWPES